MSNQIYHFIEYFLLFKLKKYHFLTIKNLTLNYNISKLYFIIRNKIK